MFVNIDRNIYWVSKAPANITCQEVIVNSPDEYWLNDKFGYLMPTTTVTLDLSKLKDIDFTTLSLVGENITLGLRSTAIFLTHDLFNVVHVNKFSGDPIEEKSIIYTQTTDFKFNFIVAVSSMVCRQLRPFIRYKLDGLINFFENENMKVEIWKLDISELETHLKNDDRSTNPMLWKKVYSHKDQSKSVRTYTLDQVPEFTFENINRKTPYTLTQ